MEHTNTPIERFFEQYARQTDTGNIPELAGCFADWFLAGGPQGAQPVRAGDFALALPRRYKLFEIMGCRSTRLTNLRETWLDTRYVSVWTQWRFNFERAGEEEALPIVAESTYILDAGAKPFRIIVYLAHTDILEVLKGHEIVPV